MWTDLQRDTESKIQGVLRAGCATHDNLSWTRQLLWGIVSFLLPFFISCIPSPSETRCIREWILISFYLLPILSFFCVSRSDRYHLTDQLLKTPVDVIKFGFQINIESRPSSLAIKKMSLSAVCSVSVFFFRCGFGAFEIFLYLRHC